MLTAKYTSADIPLFDIKGIDLEALVFALGYHDAK